MNFDIILRGYIGAQKMMRIGELGSPRGRHCLNGDENSEKMSDSRVRVSLSTLRELLVLFTHEKYDEQKHGFLPPQE
jgi:hypothetical protein